MKLTLKILSELGFNEYCRNRSLLVRYIGSKCLVVKKLSESEWGVISLDGYPQLDKFPDIEDETTDWAWNNITSLSEILGVLEQEHREYGALLEKERMKSVLGLQ